MSPSSPTAPLSSASLPITVKRLQDCLDAHLSPRGFEAHPFLVGWYNQVVADKFKLPFCEDAVAFVILSQPSMFERTFLPYLMDHIDDSDDDVFKRIDPLDKCMREAMAEVRAVISKELGDGSVAGEGVQVIHDFELLPGRRPKILAQTAAHVAGAARFLRPATDLEDPEAALAGLRSPKAYPVCVHPRFGGWFAIRAVAVLPGVEDPAMARPAAPLPDLTQGEIAEVLRLYNDEWRDWRFRDAAVARPEERYSTLQMEYFATEPAKRWNIVKKLREETKIK